jgi:exopolyphosphatase / guanosine-5'-triphosphate,3'-diphosphate pyrophosphatase
MNIASIDIGSNTVLLLIAEISDNTGNFKTIKNLYRAPRLGKGIDSTGEISSESLNKFYEVLEEYSSEIKTYNCEHVLVKATAAMRKAANREDIKAFVKNKYDIDIDIIPGDKEAQLSYLGAASILPEVSKKLVIDLGGASTEIIYGEEDNIKFRKSFPIGAVTLTDKFINNELITPEETEQIKNYCNEMFHELPSIIPASMSAIAVAGTPTTLSCIKQGLKKYTEEKVEGSVLTIGEFNSLKNELSKLTPAERLNAYGEVISGREDVILSGVIILSHIAEILELKEYHVTGKGIRYGAVVDYLNENKKSKKQ